MKDKNFPLDKPTYFEGDIRKYDAEAFGFFHYKVGSKGIEVYYPIKLMIVKCNYLIMRKVD